MESGPQRISREARRCEATFTATRVNGRDGTETVVSSIDFSQIKHLTLHYSTVSQTLVPDDVPIDLRPSGLSAPGGPQEHRGYL